MKKILNLFLLLLMSISTLAQESIVFEAKFKPNKIYKSHIKSSSSGEIEFIADKEIIDQMKSRGLELPIFTEEITDLSTEITTYDLEENGEFLAKLEYGKMISTKTINGKTSSEELPFSNMKILGKYDVENKFKIDSILGENVTQQMRAVLKVTLENVQAAIKFPEEPMMVGDVFNSEIPMAIPLEGMRPISVKIDMEYLLTEIKDGLAFFDINQSLSLDMSQDQLNMMASGEGVGTSSFDIKENYIVQYTSELPMDMTIEINDNMTMKMKMITKSDQKVTIE